MGHECRCSTAADLSAAERFRAEGLEAERMRN